MTAGDLLMWGQAGEYDAHDDRLVIAALAGKAAGLTKAPTLAAGSGLNVTVGPWHGIVDAGDGTKAVIGSRDSITVTPAAGGGTARTDILWADIDVEAGTWSPALITTGQMTGRAGLRLGTIQVPAGANAATAFQLTPALLRLWTGAQPATFPGLNVNQGTPQTLASLTIPAGDPEPGTAYEIECFGNGQQGTASAAALNFRALLGGQAMDSQVTIGTTAFYQGGNTAGSTFRWRAVIRAICQNAGASGNWRSYVLAQTTVWQGNASPGNNNFASAFATEPVAVTGGVNSTADLVFAAQGWWSATPGGQVLYVRAVIPRKLTAA